MSVAGRKNANFTKEQLEKYIAKGLSLRELTYSLNCGYDKLVRQMKEWGIKRKRIRRTSI